MKKSLLAVTFVAFSVSAKTTRLRNYGCIAIALLAGCTSTQVRWDATKMRKDVMVYYNDQIMDNLIRAKNDLPFVHVDIQSLNSQGASQISGSIGYGETITNTGTHALTTQRTVTDTTSTSPTGPGTMHMVAKIAGGLVATASHVAMRPFTYSVTPQQTETLSIIAAPALGPQALASSAPATKMEVTKETQTTDADGKTSTATDRAPIKRAITIYDLYEKFAKSPSDGGNGFLSDDSIQPEKGNYVPGTLKRWGGRYYYVHRNHQKDYYDLCKKLFTKGQAGSLEKKLEVIEAAAALR